MRKPSTMSANTLPAVLIVEDETLIRMDAVGMIMEAGFSTYEASSADQAILLMEQHAEIGILFTDIEMPGSMDGLKLAAFVRDRWPPVVIIIVSGAMGMDTTTFPEGAFFFPKPYSTSQIIAPLHEIAQRCYK